jgi:rod shape-determining protein MreC
MEYSPPPLFKQGASARAKMLFFALIAVALLMADSRLRTLGVMRQAIGTALYPLQIVAMLPRDAFFSVTNYFVSLTRLESENARMREQQVLNSQQLQQNAQLLAENTHLRRLLDASDRVQIKTLMSEILYDARDPFSRKIILDRGQTHGIRTGQPVIDDLGVIGQVTRVFPFTSEVTLLTDKDHAIPVQVLRSGVSPGCSNCVSWRPMPIFAKVMCCRRRVLMVFILQACQLRRWSVSIHRRRMPLPASCVSLAQAFLAIDKC